MGINQKLFDPVPYSPELGRWAAAQLGWTEWAHHVPNHLVWDPRDFRNRLTIWTPSPEWARQALSRFVRSWVQAPWSTAGIFLIPRILQKRWSRLCRYVMELGTFYGQLLPPPIAYNSHISFVFLYVPYHISVASGPRVGKAPFSNKKNWHIEQADEVRGLQ